LVKRDGDNISAVFDGRKMKDFGKEITPARLASLSAITNEVWLVYGGWRAL